MDKSVCFTGHRHIGKHKSQIEKSLLSVIEQLIVQRNVTDFYVGGAYGFDALASLTVLRIKETYPQVKLHMILPCSNEEQTAKWSKEQKNEFEYILAHTDSIEYISEHYYNGCMKVRNTRLVELATECCICYWNIANIRSGTGQTVRMAQKIGLEIINLYEATLHIDNLFVNDN